MTDRERLRAEIAEKVTAYFRLEHAQDEFIPGKTRVQYGGRVFDERDIHSELISAIDELLGAVEGVDEPVARPHAPLVIGWQFSLLRYIRNGVVKLKQPLTNDRFGGQIDPGYRRSVRLLLHPCVARQVMAQHHLTGSQRHPIHRIDCHHGERSVVPDPDPPQSGGSAHSLDPHQAIDSNSALIGLLKCLFGSGAPNVERSVAIVSGLPPSGSSPLIGIIAADGLETVADGLRETDTDHPKRSKAPCLRSEDGHARLASDEHLTECVTVDIKVALCCLL